MCTVTYTPKKDGFILTSSRDENIYRPTSDLEIHYLNQQNILFPQDLESKGTWVASSKNRVLCLLNGAIEFNHQIDDKLSRGKVLLENFKYLNSNDFIQNIPFERVIPFCLIQIDHNEKTTLEVIKWNGRQVKQHSLIKDKQYIWTSSSLYDSTIENNRKVSFDRWMKKKGVKPIQFHLDLIPINKKELKKKNDKLKTVSITNIERTRDGLTFDYFDLINNKKSILRL